MSDWNKKFSEYEDMLKDLSDSEDQPKPKANLNPPPPATKPQKTSNLLIKKKLDNEEDEDETLKEFEKEMGIKKPEIAEEVKMDLESKSVLKEKPISISKPKAPVSSISSIQSFLQKDQLYSPPTLIRSLLTIDAEEKDLKERVKNNKNEIVLDFQKRKMSQILDNKQVLKENLEIGKLHYNNYILLLNELISKNGASFSEAKKNGEKDHLPIIAKRMQILTNEKEKLTANPGSFNSLVKMIFPNIAISAPKKFVSQEVEKKPSSISQDFSYPQSTFPKINNKVNDMELEGLENLTLEQKIMKFKRRYKQYHNMSLYLYKNMKDTMEAELNDHWLPLLQKGKEYLKQLLNKENADLKTVMTVEFPEITTEVFNKMSNSEYKSRLESLCEKLKECKESENIYLDFLLKSKQSRMKMDEVRKKIDEYEKIFNYLQGLAVDFWIPFPCFQIIKELRSTTSENKDIDPFVLHLQFYKSSLIDSSLILQYYLIVNKKQVTGETGPSNDHGVWNSKIEVKMGENRKGIDVDLHRQSVLITVFKIKSGFLGIGEKKVILGLGEISLSDILINNRIEGKARIAGEKNQPFDVEYGIYLREPLRKENKKEFEIVKLLKAYPKFNKDEGMEEYLKEPLKFTNDPSITAKKIAVSNENSGQNSKIEEEKKEDVKGVSQKEIEEEEAPLEPIVVLRHSNKDPDYVLLSSLSPPPSFSKDEILKPEIPDKCPCVSFMEKMSELMKTARVEFSKEYDRDASKVAQDLQMSYFKTHQMMLMNIEKGAITEEGYMNLLKKGLERDRKLKDFYDLHKVGSWSKFVQVRMNYVQRELASS